MNPASDEVVDWANLPSDAKLLSLSHTLHDGDLVNVVSDLLARSVTLTFDVLYLRDFHHLPDDSRFVVTLSGVKSARSARSVRWPGEFSIPAGTPRDEERRLVAEYQSKWREQSQDWDDFERHIGSGVEVSDATLAVGRTGVALKLGVLTDNDYVKAVLRGRSVTFRIGAQELTTQQFVQFGEPYWTAFASKRNSSDE